MIRAFQFLLLIITLISIPACDVSAGESAQPNDQPVVHESEVDIVPEVDISSPQAAAVAAIRQTLAQQAEAGMSGVFLLQIGESILIHEAYGWQDRETKRPMALDTGFDMGSIVKAITAATIFKLEEEGQLQTTNTVGQFFPEAPAQIREITIDQLLTHTSGLSEYLGDDYELVDREAALSRIFETRLQFAPGTREAYSNKGYTLLALMIEAVSEMPYEQAVREAVFIPAATLGIGYRLADWTPEDLAVGYQRRRRWGTPLDHAWLEDGPSWTLRGNGGMIATADELAQWFDAVFSGRVLGEEALEQFSALYIDHDDYGQRIGTAGGNDVFNAQYEGWVTPGVRATFFTSVSSHSAENIWQKISGEVKILAETVAQSDAVVP